MLRSSPPTAPRIETPFASSWKGSAKPDVTLVEFFDYACPYCKASNPAVDRLVQEDKGLRVVYRELPILGPDSVTAARLSLEASKAGPFRAFHDALWAAGRPAPDTIAVAAKAAGSSPEPTPDPAIEAELKRNFQLAGQLGATGTPLFVVGDRVMNGRSATTRSSRPLRPPAKRPEPALLPEARADGLDGYLACRRRRR